MRKYLTILCVLFVSLFALSSCSYTVSQPDANVNNIFNDGTIVNTSQTQINETFKKVEPACVGVETITNKGKSIGSGVIYRLKDAKTNGEVNKDTVDVTGYVVTNAHVVDDGVKFKVYVDETKGYLADLIGKDVKNDLAVLKFNRHYSEDDIKNNKNNDLKAIDILGKEINVPQQGNMVLAIGCPLNLSNFNFPTSGLVSKATQKTITHSAPINPGNSGGGLFDVITGELVGINVSKLIYETQNDSNGNPVQVPITSIGHAIPVWLVKEVILDIEANNKDIERPLLGVTLAQITASLENNNSLQLPPDLDSGIVIFKVDENSNASRAKSSNGAIKDGLMVGDVITQVNGLKITRMDDISYILGISNMKDVITITIRRYINNSEWTTYLFNVELL